ncbi:MAG: molybdopterin-dependent oxidoreductase [Acidobacteriota bacterium]
MEILKLDIYKTEPEELSEREARFQVSLLASIAAVAVAFLARFVFDAPLVAEMMTQWFFAIAPIWMVEMAVGLLGPFAKHLAFLACAVLYAIALAAAAFLYLRYLADRGSQFIKKISLIGFALSVWAATLLVIMPLLGAGVAGRYLPQGAFRSSLWMLAVSAVLGLTLEMASRLYREKPQSAGSRLLDRRRVIRSVGYAVLAVGLYDIGRSLFHTWFEKGSGRVKGGDGVFPNIDGLALEVTPTKDFYEVSKNPFDPQVDTSRWRLEVAGLVNERMVFTYDEIRALPSVEQYATLACISNEVGGDLIGNALWRGVRLRDVLERAGLKEGIVDIVLTASDDYRDSIPLDRAMMEGTLLVYEMNGERLTSSHGFPLRLIVPGIYGMKNVKWIKRIEAVDFDFKGYWQRRGWDDRAEYQTMSRIDAPTGDAKGEAVIAGIAFAGDRRVSKVEVSTDGGRTWEEAEIKAPMSPYTWSLWQKRWTPSAGKHTVVVRATDGRGVTQTSQRSRPDPAGSTGHHRVTVEAE